MTDTDFKFIYFDKLSPIPSNDFYNLHCEINSYEFQKNVQIIESKYRKNKQKNNNKYNKKKIIKSIIHLQNHINIFYKDIQDFQQFINYKLNYQFI
jgi:hypothetical protein